MPGLVAAGWKSNRFLEPIRLSELSGLGLAGQAAAERDRSRRPAPACQYSCPCEAGKSVKYHDNTGNKAK